MDMCGSSERSQIQTSAPLTAHALWIASSATTVSSHRFVALSIFDDWVVATRSQQELGDGGDPVLSEQSEIHGFLQRRKRIRL